MQILICNAKSISCLLRCFWCRVVWYRGYYRDETLYLGGFEIYRRYDHSTDALLEERKTAHISDDARRICMIETKTVTAGSSIGSPTPRYRFQLDNHVGTVAVEVDETGSVISYEEYHPYGTSAYRAWGGVDVSAKRYRYNGKEKDEQTKLYYYGARYYAPWLGRWCKADPLAFADGVGAYTYVRGSPVVFEDPNGEQTAPTSNQRSPNTLAGELLQMSLRELETPTGGMSTDPGMSIDPSMDQERNESTAPSNGQPKPSGGSSRETGGGGHGGAAPYLPVETPHTGGAPPVREPMEGAGPGRGTRAFSPSRSLDIKPEHLYRAFATVSDFAGGPLKAFAAELLVGSIILSPRSEEEIARNKAQRGQEATSEKEQLEKLHHPGPLRGGVRRSKAPSAEGRRVPSGERGTWTGQRGEGVYTPEGTDWKIPFRGGAPDFTGFVEEERHIFGGIKGLKGRASDTSRMLEAVRERFGSSTTKEARAWLASYESKYGRGLELHHSGPGEFQLVPAPVHQAAQHGGFPGSASALRKKHERQ